MSLLDPTAISDPDDYTPEDFRDKGLVIRRFKKDIRDQVEGDFRDRITEVLLAEVETGAGGRDAGEIGAVKGAKVAALLEGVDHAGTVGPITLPNPKLAKVLFWCGTPHVEQGLRPGLLRGLGTARRPVVTTNASFLPLTPPPGTGKKELPAVLAALAQAVGGPAWKWYREGETAPRFGYPRDPSPPKPR